MGSSKKSPKKPKKALTKAHKLQRKKAKEERQKKYEWIFVNGKQKRILRRPSAEELKAKEELLRNEDPIWLQQNDLWEYIDMEECDLSDELPF